MCEESACLVPPLESVRNGSSSESRPSFASSPGGALPGGGLSSALRPCDGEALVGFHEDALAQAAVGRAQLLLAAVLGLALAADCAETAALALLMPAAELHLCIGERRKAWLVSITLLAMAGGSLAWGILGDHLGRRRALISAMSVATLFSAVAAVMPTYGTFMTARFCSGVGVAGALPLGAAWLAETCSRSARPRLGGALLASWPLGALAAAALARATMPAAPADIVSDHRDHWSSWHRYLLLSVAPGVLCLAGLAWASESPRYLLEAAREVEALAVYQRLRRLNRARTRYGLAELELPAARRVAAAGVACDRPGAADVGGPPPATRNVFSNSLDSFRDAFLKVSSPTHLRTTLLLATLHFLLGFVYMGMSTLAAASIKHFREEDYYSHRQFVNNGNFSGSFLNLSIENVQYSNSIFTNVTFNQINLNHVDFINCTVEDSEFINVKASMSYFRDSTIKDSRFIDTDFTDHHFVGCRLVNNTFLSLVSDCAVDFDYNVYLDDLYAETMAWSGAMCPALLLTGFALQGVARPPALAAAAALAGLAGAGVAFAAGPAAMAAVDLLVRVASMCAVETATLVVVEAYPCHLRCTALGMMRSLFHIASLCAIPIYSMLVHTVLVVPAVMTVLLSFLSSLLATKIQDNSKVLL